MNEHGKEFGAKSIAFASRIGSSKSNATTASSSVAAATDGAAAFSGMTVELSPLLMSQTLQTLHENTELNLSGKHTSTRTTTDHFMPKLTSNLLLATAAGRLEVRPQG